MLNSLMNNGNTLNLESYEAMEQHHSKEEIWEILQGKKSDEEGIHRYLDSGALVGKARVQIDANEKSMHWEGGIYNARIEEVANFIKQVEPQAEKLLKSGMLHFKNFRIGYDYKEADQDPFVNGGVRALYLNDRRVAIIFSARTEFNHAEIDFVIYPKLILKLLEKEKKANQ